MFIFYPPISASRCSQSNWINNPSHVNLKNKLLIRINDSSVIICGLTGKFSPVIHMYMPVNKKSRMIFVKQGSKYLKASVGQIVIIVELVGRRMGEQNVEALISL